MNSILSFSNFQPWAFFRILETIFLISWWRPKAENLRKSEYNSLIYFRFEKLKKMREDRDVSAARDVSASRDVSAAHDTDRPSMEELTARRKANLEKMHREDRPRVDEYLLPGRWIWDLPFMHKWILPTSLIQLIWMVHCTHLGDTCYNLQIKLYFFLWRLFFVLANSVEPDEIMHFSGLPQALEIMENLENHKKCSMHGKIMEFEKNPE